MSNSIFGARPRCAHSPGGGAAAVVRAVALLGLAVGLVAITSCDLGFFDETGNLEVSVGSVSTLTLVPDIDMTVHTYRLDGSGPDGAAFTETISGGSTVIRGLTTGDWVVDVTGMNADGTAIASGSGSIEVVPGETADLSVTVRPFDGPGSLDVQVSWPAADVADANLSADLLAADGTSQSVTVSLGGSGAATITAGSIPAGYYSLSLQLFDGGTVVAGAVESTRIADGAVTSGTVAFSDVNEPTGDVDIIIDPDLDEPLEITIGGGVDAIARGGSMDVTASVDNAGGEPVNFSWYVNGAFAANGSATTVGSDLDPGTYRLDVVAFTDDGTRSGSASHTFTVTE